MSDTKFRPVQGTDEQIKNSPYTEGYTYFAKDTGRIYLDTDGERVPLGGGGVSVLYAEAAEVKENVDGTYSIQLSDLTNEDTKPSTDDLIINSDGRFFRVIDFDGAEIYCSLIAVSGTGGGGGGGDSGGGSTALIKLEVITGIKSPYIFGQSSYAVFKATATEDDVVTYTITVTSGDSKKTIQRSADSGAEFSFDIGKELYAGVNLVTVMATGANSGSTSPRRYPSINCIEMLLKESPDFNPLQTVTGALSFKCVPVGNVDKTLKIYIDGDLKPELTIENLTTSDIERSVTIPVQEHGVHTIKAVLSTGAGGAEAFATPLEYEIAWVEKNNLTPIIWFKEIPEEIVNHSNYVLNYKVLDPSSREKTEANLWLNGTEIPTSPVTVSYDTSNLTWEKWALDGYRLGDNSLSIVCGTTSRSFNFTVVKDSRDMEIHQDDLFLNLTSSGRSNSENKTSRSQWTYTNASGEKTSVALKDFNWYNNGWILDEDEKPCLRISNGASISIPLSVMNDMTLRNSLTFEFQFKLRNVQEYTTLIETASEEVNGQVIITKKVNTEKGVFAKYYNNDAGFCLGTQEAFFKASGNAIVDARYKEDEIINLTFVVESPSVSSVTPLMYIYLNGVMSGISTYKTDSNNFNAEVNALTFNSNYCDIDLYKLRVYKTNLASHIVTKNYIADLNDAELYDMNQIVIFENNIPKVDYNKVVAYNEANPDNPTMPYAILELSENNGDERLPYKKGNKRLMNVTFVNPSLDNAYAKGLITDEDYVTKCPSFKATYASFDVQGTSSQGYPRRNFKGKFKNTKDYPNDCTWVYTNGPLKDQSMLNKVELNGKKYRYFYMDNKDAAESTFTWKADYMESSGTHNTGFASFVKTLYDNHPLVDYLKDDYTTGDHRTTIYGFPMMVFQKYKNGTYEFVGKYNFNLDKGCNNVIDFENETAHPFVEGTFTDDEGKEQPLDFAHIAECWELKNNQGTRCSFNKVDFEETDNGVQTGAGTGKLTVHNDFEYRYSYYEDDIDDAIDRVGDFVGNPELANKYLLDKFKNLKALCEWLYSVNTKQATGEEFPEPVVITTTAGETTLTETYTHDTAEYRLAKFKNEFSKHFNKHYCLIYFIMTEMLVQYDSRGKNMMLGSWGPQTKGGDYIWYPLYYDIDTQLGVNNSGVPSWEYYVEATEENQFSTSDSVLWNNFFTCFLDDIKSTYNTLRNGNLTITKLDGFYNADPSVSKSYAMQGCRPINMINVDEYYKYIAPSFSGYLDTEGKEAKDTGLYFYCLQGTREMHRALFLKNRFNFLDSKWVAGTYDVQGNRQEFQARLNANAWDENSDKGYTSDKYIEKEPAKPTDYVKQAIADGRIVIQEYGLSPFDTTPTVTLTPFLRQYVSVMLDETMVGQPVLYNGSKPISLQVLEDKDLDSFKNTLDFSQQLFYIGGSEYISSFGDLSTKYLNELHIQKAKRIRDLYVGNDEEGYINTLMQDSAFELGAGAYTPVEGGGTVINPNAKTLLETLVLSNIPTLTSTQDISGSTKLKQLRALGTQIGGVTLAEGVPVEQLYLPKTITAFNLTEPTNLHGLIQIKPVKDSEGNFPNGLYLEGITDKTSYAKDDAINLNSIKLIGGSLNYDSYKLLDIIINIKDRMQQNEDLDPKYNKRLYLYLEDVNWTPYRLLEKGELPDSNYTYVKKTEHYTFDHTYVPDNNWDIDVLNGRIYEFDEDLFNENANVVTDLSMVDKFIDSYNSIENYYRSTNEADGANTLPYLTGNIFVNNSADNLISEAELKNKYKDLYYKDLNIFVAHAKESYVAKFVETLDSGIEKEWYALKYEPIAGEVQYPDVSVFDDYGENEYPPIKNHYDFIGWADVPNATEDEVITDFSEYVFSDDNKVYTFYAVYKKHNYSMTFYNGDEVIETISVEYGQPVTAPLTMPYKDDSALALERRYGFKGYTDNKALVDPSNAAAAADAVKDLSKIIAEKDIAFYAIFLEESVYDNILDSSYYTITPSSYTNFNTNVTTYGSMLTIIKPIAGKVTLPTKDLDGNPIIQIDVRAHPTTTGARMSRDVTHVFFDNKNPIYLKEICQNAFQASKIKYIQLGDVLERISDSAFNGCNYLEMYQWESSLVVIGNNAFNQAYGIDYFERFIIGGTVTNIEPNAFSYMDLDIGTLQFGSVGSPCQMYSIGDRAFAFNGGYNIGKIEVYYSDDNVVTRFNEWKQNNIFTNIKDGGGFVGTEIDFIKV